MAWMNAYLVCKVYLHFTGRIRLALFWSLALYLASILPLPRRFRGAKGERARLAALVAVAALVLWSEAGLPPLAETARFLGDSTVSPSPGYVLGFLWGCVNPKLVAGLIVMTAVVFHVKRIGLNVSALGAGALLLVLVTKPQTLFPARPKSDLTAFYAAEAERRAPMPVPAGPALDVIVLQVCSFSWDDLRAAGMPLPRFVSGADALLERFNTATSYSNPAALRLLRASCGQAEHDALYRDPPAECLLMEGLRSRGYKTWSASNHDGTYDDFARTVTRLGGADAPMPTAGLEPALLNFDESPIFRDWDVLSRWWAERLKSKTPRAALYYNSVTLHQGAREPSAPRAVWVDRPGRYRRQAAMLFEDLERFAALLDASGRKGVIVLVPEHGAALEGTPMQPPDLRVTPLPGLTLAPAAFRLFGQGRRPAEPHVLARTASYIDAAQLIAQCVARPPFGRERPSLALFVASLAGGRHVAENQGVHVAEDSGRYLYKVRTSAWMSLPPGAERGAVLPVLASE